MILAKEALQKLQDGNQRFVSGVQSLNSLMSQTKRESFVAEQRPFAVILGCSDSRVPAELVFDQGIGDLFVIRVAGNIVEPNIIGSVEFAVDKLGTQLVVVLGHSSCGAVQATLGEMKSPSENLSPNLQALVNNIRPAIDPLMTPAMQADPTKLIHHAVRANVRASAKQLQARSQVITEAIQNKGLLVIGAEYSLETGVVDFFDGVPEGA